MARRTSLLFAVCVLAMPLAVPPATAEGRADVELLSTSVEGSSGNGLSFRASVSADGTRAAFFSYATNLVAGDTNGLSDVFLRDRRTATTTLISRSVDGGPSNGHAYGPMVTRDGRHVVFESTASNLVPGDEGDTSDIFVHDVQTGATTLVSRGLDGEPSNGSSWFGVPSPDGTVVAFWSAASNLVPGDGNGGWDVFVHDLRARSTERVSLDSAGGQAQHWFFFPECYPAVSAGGAQVAFCSEAELTDDDVNGSRDVYVRDRAAGVTTLESAGKGGVASNGWSSHPSITPDGRFVSFWSAASNLVPGDANGQWDVFVRDRDTNETERISVASDGLEGTALSDANSQALSDDGRYVAFESLSGELRGSEDSSRSFVYIHDRLSRTTHAVTPTDATPAIGSQWASITPDGSSVVFESDAATLVGNDANNDWDVFAATSDLLTAVTDASVVEEATALRVSASATFAPVRVSSAADTVGDQSRPIGPTVDIVGASVVYRPAEASLVFAVDLAVLRFLSPPAMASGGIVRGVAGTPPASYVTSWKVGGVRYEIRASHLEDGGPGLYRCAPSCTLLQRVPGSIGTVGDTVVMSVPAAALGDIGAGDVLTDITAWTSALGETVDSASLPAATVPALRVEAGTGAAASDAGVAYTELPSVGGRFEGTIAKPTPEAPVVWVRACTPAGCRGERAAPSG